VNTKEIEFDAVAKTNKNHSIDKHLENAGVHSADATDILPAQKSQVKLRASEEESKCFYLKKRKPKFNFFCF